MRVISVGASSGPRSDDANSVSIDGTIVPLAVVDDEPPVFDPRRLVNASQVLVRVDAFSCNYRDKSLIVDAAVRGVLSDQNVNRHFGSEFVGTVVACGRSVTRWREGDRVMPNAAYPGGISSGFPAGIVTNEASSGWVRVSEDRLAAVPANMSDEVAASFSLGAQTAASMIRRAQVKPGERVLVTSARSNTSIFLIGALIRLGADVVGWSSSEWTPEEEQWVSGCNIIPRPRTPDNLQGLTRADFDVVMDPFFDLNMSRAVREIRVGGRYVTCGMQNQHPLFQSSVEVDDELFRQVMFEVIIRNIQVIGNCIGTSDDLKNSLAEYDPNDPRVPIDRVYGPGDGQAFLNRTFNERDRFGKVVLVYDA